MPKVKKEPFESTNRKNIFFFEILGVILLLLSFFALARLGTFGFYLNLTVKLIFGDWSFLFILLGICLGGYFLFMHQNIPISSLRFIGIIIIFISLSILSHFAMHQYISKYTTNYFKTTINLYFDYYKTGSITKIIGGGLFGMLFFYLFYYLISTPGVLIVSIGMMILGISFISKKTLIDICLMFINGFKKSFKFIRSRGSKLKTLIGKINNEYLTYNRKKLPKNFMTKTSNNQDAPLEYLKNITNDIKVILNKINLFHYEVNNYYTPHLLVFEIKSLLTIDLRILEDNLVRYLKEPFLIKINEDDNIIMIEMLNPNIRKILLFESINYMNDGELFMTIDDHNNVISLDSEHHSILLFNNDINNFLFYVILSMINRNNYLVLIDLKEELLNIKDYVNVYQNSSDYLDQLIVNIENNDFDELVYCFINLDVNCKNINNILEKIKYIMQIAKNNEIYFVVRINQFLEQNIYFYDLFSYLYTVDIDDVKVLKLFGFNSPIGLKIGSEGLLKCQDLIMRVANCYLTDKEKNQI